MVQTSKHESSLDGVAPGGDLLEKTTTRRNFILGALGLGGVAAITGYREFASSSQSPTVQDGVEGSGKISNREVTLEESRARIEELNQDAELFGDIDPHVLYGLEYDELVDIGGVTVTEANYNDVDIWAKDYLDKHLLFMRAGGTKKDLLLGIDRYEIQTGVRDDSGVLVTRILGEQSHESHGEFVNRHYGAPMLAGMGPDNFKGRDMSKVKDAMLYSQKRAVDLFEGNATKIDPAHSTLNTTTYLESYDVEELDVEEGAFFDLDDAKRVRIDFQTWKNSGNNKLIDENSVTMTYRGDARTGRYLIMFEHFISRRLDE